MSRADELAANLATVRARIDVACHAAGRDPAEVTLVAVTKTHPLSDIEALAGLGVRHMAENRDQEAASKAEQGAGLDVVWHFVGQVQTNKARSVAAYADVVEAVDRVRLVEALSHAAVAAGRVLDVLVQVSLAQVEGRGGVPLDPAFRTLLALADEAADAPGLRFAGLMAVAPLGADPAQAFARLAEARAAVTDEHPHATMLSAGMSGDLEQAIAYGSTHVRVGTALLGVRFAPVV
ncbi:YggS family pyridoxal phosphate-dependent enzyme [Acidothermaceae bacterium B102]|nr:YggS family pyridoxal phosphate-dependent enzyme [Acidothermaceae bacterium B102]